MKQVVLITGCSSGIGRALSLRFQAEGFRVFASARRPETLTGLKKTGVETLALDVTDAATIKSAVEQVIGQAGRIDYLVNNAGYGLMGPAAELPIDEVRRQFETNVIGALALVQEVVPHMVKAGSGRIVNVSSVSGVLTTPFAGPYCASKAALTALSDALRLELEPFGIKVITVQPGGVVSKFGDTATVHAEQSVAGSSMYKNAADIIRDRAKKGQEGAMDSGEFARRMVLAVTMPTPPAVFRCGVNSVKLPGMKWALPVRFQDLILKRAFGLDRIK
ncbi:MAG: SDR family oxidoreductase [Myxococcota bacterium]|jgi:NAD(P)-dependent dehydrogenase (short-subunit alcohol dehydrogenase family)